MRLPRMRPDELFTQSKLASCWLCLFVLVFSPAVGAVELSGPIRSDAAEAFASTQPSGSLNAQLAGQQGYQEQEFFFSGHANIYGYDHAGELAVLQEKIPFTSRMLLVRPADPARFSGRVFMVPTHPARGAGFWDAIRDYVLRSGDAYVGVFIGTDQRSREISDTSGEPADALSLLKAWSPERYAAIQWPDDDGIRWDVFGQLARFLRSDNANSPFKGDQISNLYAVGWSFTSSFLRVFINDGFHDRYRRADGSPVIDGYLIGISNADFRSGYLALNTHSQAPAEDDPRREPRPIDVPVIELMTQNEAITRTRKPNADMDSELNRHRVYEVPGLTHGDGLQDEGAADECPFPSSDIPFRHFIWSTLSNLDLWVKQRIAPPPTALMALDAKTRQAITDRWGNALGGIRPAQIEVPLARYGDPQLDSCTPKVPYYLVMRRIPFSPEQLAELYPGGANDYLQRMEAQLDKLLRERWILAEDRDAQLTAARQAAAKAFPNAD